jgi:hypothetical protein
MLAAAIRASMSAKPSSPPFFKAANPRAMAMQSGDSFGQWLESSEAKALQ